MRYYDDAMEAELLGRLKSEPDACIVLAPEFYREDGHVTVHRKHRMEYLHRRLYRLAIGDLQRGVFLLPDCESVGCVNPHHRFLSLRASRHDRTHCKRGHSLEGMPRDSRGHRPCRTCAAERRPKRAPMSRTITEINASKTHCPRGHGYTPENTYVWTDKNGVKHRSCRACKITPTHEGAS